MRLQIKIVAVTSLVILAACTTAKMQLDPSLNSVVAMDVEGANPRRWNTPIRFGPWSTLEAREGWNWNFGLPLLGITAAFERQPYRLSVSSGDEPLQAECVTRSLALSRKGLSVDPSFGRIPALACGFQRPDGSGQGTLRLRTTATNAEEGTIAFGPDAWRVRSVRKLEGSSIPSGEPLGYEILRGSDVIAAVETINRGRVWMSPSLSEAEKARLAAIATALLLYEPADAAE